MKSCALFWKEGGAFMELGLSVGQLSPVRRKLHCFSEERGLKE